MAEQKDQYMWPSHWGRPVAHGPYGAVSSNSIYATRAGLEILRQGGNAFDASAAVSLALSVVEPHHSGIGGGCFSLIYSAKDNAFHSVDGRGVAPQNAKEDLFLKDGVVQDEWKDLGGQSVAIPGLLKTLEVMLEKYGTMTLSQVMAPAIRLAEEGLYVGRQVDGQYLFDEDRPVSRDEFLALAVAAAELSPLEDVTITGFFDDQAIPTWAKGSVAAALKALFHGAADTHQRGAGSGDDVAQAPHGLAVGHEIVDDEDAVALMEPLLGDQERDLFLIGVGEDVALVEAALDVVALGLLGKDHGLAEAVSHHGGEGDAGGLRRQDDGDTAHVEAATELVRDVLQKLGVHPVVQEAVHLDDVAGEDFALPYDAILQLLHMRSPPMFLSCIFARRGREIPKSDMSALKRKRCSHYRR